MVSNVSFALLDAAIIAGRGDDPAVGPMTHARLLEEVAAIGGVLHHLGVGPGVPVLVALEQGAGDLDAVVAALATARVGGVVRTTDHPDVPVVVMSEGAEVPGDPRGGDRLRLVRGAVVSEPDLDWDVMLRAGRTDPAACEVLPAEAAYSPERSVAEQIGVLDGLRSPYDAAELRAVLQV